MRTSKIRGNRVSPTPSLRGGARFPPPAGFKGGQNIRANVACTAWERPRARLWSPLSSEAGEGEGVRTTQRIPTPYRPSALIRSVRS